MEPALQINSVFRGAGWKVVKPLEPLSSSAMVEDMAQFTKRSVIVSFGHYGDAEAGDFRVYAIRDGDWQKPLAAISIRNADMALDLLRQMPGLLGRLGPL
ncbi:hypothetical protein [Mameliella sediminis]|uniref:hypothetical protein n=1 Tax=Mameliella sediminis TaxID=2836866 RepID=UPI001C4910D5|nr:hypothetical protein [Mameliella sediminis]MBY6114805.1 hypothetical protein [Antarctobacter heliothermus]MBY6144378.1 hypothetical protein [Mameliella alba]MBV7392714.1 hypothetical protein [Mameliella sediminis]MBY6163440.1 hypothetical protein [Mameliella alba]MBY6171703.1 hypothetical protein [Mameliella alba]